MHTRIRSLLLAAILLWGLPLGLTSVAADGFQPRPSYAGDCGESPPGTTCLVFEDGYRWLVADIVTAWGVNHGTVQIAYGRTADYAHALGTTGAWTLAK